MAVRRGVPFLVLIGLLPGAAARAEKLDEESKEWLDSVAPIILREEEKAFKSLKDKGDRDEFRKIFWARRNPLGAAAADNPYRARYEALQAEADRRFTIDGKRGSTTDCARVFVLLGSPNRIWRATGDVRTSTQSEGELRMGGTVRSGQTWIYKDRPGFTFTGGEIQVAFDTKCELPAGGSGFLSQLIPVAEGMIVDRNLGYKVVDGRLVRKLADFLPASSPSP